MPVYYNEYDKRSAQWIRNMIRGGLLPEGDVDERSIKEVQAEDLQGYTQCHFFAGIGGWPLAIQLAGVDTSEPIWTGSCPCQPFSRAGKLRGTRDDRHLWPEFYRLIEECGPPRIFGEQVASKQGLKWLDIVFDDLEGKDYSCRAADLPAASVGLPHVRQRLFWNADANSYDGDGQRDRRVEIEDKTWGQLRKEVEAWRGGFDQLVSMGITERDNSYTRARSRANGIPGIVGKIRGFGNAIVPLLAAEFIKECS